MSLWGDEDNLEVRKNLRRGMKLHVVWGSTNRARYAWSAPGIFGPGDIDAAVEVQLDSYRPGHTVHHFAHK